VVLAFALAACSSHKNPASSDAPMTTCAALGLLHAQPLQVDTLERYYMLYVPSSHRCDGPALPLLIDFHGTWAGSASDNGEEFYALPGLIAESEALGFIVARPRSLYSDEGGEDVYRWDENPGDYGRNADFAHALVDHREGLYHIDASRVYASGFSSGTGMTAQFFADDPQVFHGYAFVGGGFWATEPPASYNLAAAPRMYGVSGYRDYLFEEQQVLTAALAARSGLSAPARCTGRSGAASNGVEHAMRCGRLPCWHRLRPRA
jgi:poly(3-hydroxybutyrate) depolymerase